MRRVFVFTPDLLFYSQVKGLVEQNGWSALRLTAGFPSGDFDGDALVVDATRDLPSAYAVLDEAQGHRPWLVLACHQHLHPEVGEECVKHGATEAVRRGALLTRLGERLAAGVPPPKRA